MENNLNLRIFFYGKNALDDILKINKILDIKLYEDNKCGIDQYIGTDKKNKWEYYIFQCDINKNANDIIAKHLFKIGDEIGKIMKNHSEGEINEKLNKEISNILFKNLYFYDVLVISVDDLLDIDSRSAFQYFQGFSKIKAQQPFIIFLTKKENNPKITDLFQFITNEIFDKRNVYAFKFPQNEEEIEKLNNFFY